MTPEPQSNDAPALLAAIEADYAAAKQNLEFQRGHRDANFEDGYKQCMDQWMPALRLVFAELEQAKRTLALRDRQLKDKDAAIRHWIDKHNEIQKKLC